MTLSRFIALALVALSLTTAATASADTPTVGAGERQQWTIDSAQAISNTPIRLTNLVQNSALAYKATAPGLKLYWGGTGSTVYGGSWTFQQRDPSATVRDHRSSPLANGETVALYNPYQEYLTSRGMRKGMYLSYNKSSNTAQLQWKINKGDAVEWSVVIDPATKRMSLYNTRKGDYLVFDQASRLIGWQSKQTTQGATHDASVTMNAQPVTQGFVPFLGYFGGGVGFKSVLTEVRNPSSGSNLSFVKPGHSTQECGNANAVIGLAPGAALTASQMTTLYGSATPSLNNNRIAFLACAVTNSSSVWVNVKYRDI
jgi:hypothetical protein